MNTENEEKTTTEDLERIAGIYSKYKDYMFSLTAKYLPDQEDVEDVVRDALICLIQNASALEKLNKSRTETYVNMTVRSAVLDYLDKRKCRQEYFDDKPFEQAIILNWINESINSMEDSVLQDEQNRAIKTVIDGLPERMIMLFVSKCYLGLDDSELLTLMGYRKQSLCTMTRRAKQIMQKELEKEGIKDEKE